MAQPERQAVVWQEPHLRAVDLVRVWKDALVLPDWWFCR